MALGASPNSASIPTGTPIEKKHRVAVTRALRRMVLPSTWGVRMFRRRGSEYCIYDRCDLDSTLRSGYLEHQGDGPLVESFEGWKASAPQIIKDAKTKVSDACRYRDASPLGKVEIELASQADTTLGLSEDDRDRQSGACVPHGRTRRTAKTKSRHRAHRDDHRPDRHLDPASSIVAGHRAPTSAARPVVP
jgi:hypothetical protein